MRRHDWMTLALIGLCALPSLGLTSVLCLRLMDAEKSEVQAQWASESPAKVEIRQFNSDVRLVPYTIMAKPTTLRFTDVKILRLKKSAIHYHWKRPVDHSH